MEACSKIEKMTVVIIISLELQDRYYWRSKRVIYLLNVILVQ